MHKILIFIDHDIIIRNFYKLKIFKKLENKFDIKYVFPNHKRVTIDPNNLDLKNFKILDCDLERIYNRKIFGYIKRLHSSRKFPRGEKEFVFDFLRAIFGRYLIYFQLIKTFPIIHQIWSFFYQKKIGQNKNLENFIKNEKPKLIIHPTVLNGIYVDDLILIGKKFKIPTLYLMNSWDNTRVKNFSLKKPDHLFVWGEESKYEAKKFLSMDEKDLTISGPAFYHGQKKVEDQMIQDFRKLFFADKNTFFLCYGGSSKGLNEIKHLEKIEQLIDNSKENIKVLYRPHPWKDFNKNEKLFDPKNFKNIFLDPFSKENYLSIYKKKNMQIDQVSPENTSLILKSVDAIISPLSTILIDAAALGTPSASYNYNDGEKNDFVKLYKKLVSINDFNKKIESEQCNHFDDIWNTILKLKTNSKDEELKKRIIKKAKYIMDIDKDYFKLLKKKCEELSNY